MLQNERLEYAIFFKTRTDLKRTSENDQDCLAGKGRTAENWSDGQFFLVVYYSLATIGVDAAENGPSNLLQNGGPKPELHTAWHEVPRVPQGIGIEVHPLGFRVCALPSTSL